jgi:excisionase family DNA binding protein
MTVTDESPRWEKFFTVSEVAAILGVSMMTVYRLVREKHLVSIRVGRSYRIPESAVDKATREGVTG